LNIDAGKIVVAGDSAGGNLAAAVALRARDESGPKLCMQMLIYPVLDPSCDSTSYHAFAEGFGLSKVTMEWFWKQYLGGDADVGSPLIAPSKATSLAGLPATHLITAEYDVLRDEGEQFAQQLMEAGVEVKHRRYPGMLHGFIHFSGVFDDGVTAISDVATAIRNGTSSAK
jgi:acetyl esterase